MSTPSVPTIDDLRVKLCYICREEEAWDEPANPPTRWVHPCTCTLIAHESCLLEWIKSSESSRERTPANYLKCPQCGSEYGIESKNPFILRLMDMSGSAATIGGITATTVALGSLVASVGTGVYILLSGFGAFTIHHFVGDEMYKLLLPDNPSEWSLQAYLTLPLIPIGLLAGQTRRYRNLIPLSTLILSWPAMPPVVKSPVAQMFHYFFPFLNTSSNAPQLFNSISDLERATVKDVFFSWPPSPFMLCLIIPVTRRVYEALMTRLRLRVLGSQKPEAEGGGRGALDVNEGWRLEVQVRDANDQAAAHPDPDANDEDAANAQDVQALARDDAQVVVQVDGIVQVNGVPVEGNGPDAVPAVAPAPAVAENPAPANQDPRARNLLFTGNILGRLLGGAFMIPTAASIMGSLLRRLALPSAQDAHRRIDVLPPPIGFSPRYILQKFLAIRPPGSARLHPYVYLNVNTSTLSPFQMVRYAIAVCNRSMFVGSPAWTSADPVWWRNTVGLGLWFLAKDCYTLAHEWLTRREILSRHVKNRSFAGINPKELDLKPSSVNKFASTEAILRSFVLSDIPE